MPGDIKRGVTFTFNFITRGLSNTMSQMKRLSASINKQTMAGGISRAGQGISGGLQRGLIGVNSPLTFYYN